jgi:aconitate hydratase
MAKKLDSFGTKTTISVGSKTFTYHSIAKLKQSHPQIAKLPYSLKVLLENLLRLEDGVAVTKDDITALINWDAKTEPDKEIQFMPARVILQDFTGVPCVADLAAMRDAIKSLGGDADRINPLQPADLVIDHSVMVDYFGTKDAVDRNAAVEFERNKERYAFLRWGQNSLRNFRVVPPDTGIVHQVNIEHLAPVAMVGKMDGQDFVYMDTVVGTDSHTTMVNGLGVLGWGVGGIEAEAAMLGQPISMLIPQVVGFRMTGRLRAGATATDLVLTVTQMLRKKGVVGKFVEFYGPGLDSLTLADRATIANMAPEYGATCGLFPVDNRTVEYLRLTGRDESVCQIVEGYYKAQGLFGADISAEATFSDTLELDLATVEPCLAGPARPQDRVNLRDVPASFEKATAGKVKPKTAKITSNGQTFEMTHGNVVIAAITSCTNTSNPSVLMAAGLLAKNAVTKGLKVKPWVKTSLAPGSKAVTEYLKNAGLMESLEKIGFHVVGYGCTTCIGNSGPLPEAVAAGIKENDLFVASVLSGNRNFEGRVHPQVRANYLASPPLVVAYALAGTVVDNLDTTALGIGANGQPVYLKDIWPSDDQVRELVQTVVNRDMFTKAYGDVFDGDRNWKGIQVPTGNQFTWDNKSTYIKKPPFFDGLTKEPKPVADIKGARALAVLGDSITTDHISPAGDIAEKSPAGSYLKALGVEKKDFNSYGARRGNHEVMIRGTFANIRLKNLMVPGVEGGVTVHVPTGKQMTIYDAAEQYAKSATPLIVVAGKEYGTGSSRDWAAKGTLLLGVRAVLVESFERIHRSNLVGMGVLPLQFLPGETRDTHGITGTETFDICGLASVKAKQKIDIHMTRADGSKKTFQVLVRIDTPNEVEYYRNGGILQYVLRSQLR